MTIRIKHDNGTYFHMWTTIGPAFGATKEEAATYSSEIAALQEQGKHYAFGETVIEKEQSAEHDLRMRLIELRREVARYLEKPGCNSQSKKTAMERLRWALERSND